MHYIINITGGEKSGKKEIIQSLKKHYEKLGFSVLVDYSVYDAKDGTYEKKESAVLFSLSKIIEFKEKNGSENEKLLFISCFGIMDLKASMNEADFEKLLLKTDLKRNDIYDLYDGVFYLDTKNPDDKEYINIWTGHNHLRMIDFYNDFSDKEKELISETDSFIGEPVHFEIEKKFIIKYPDLSYLDNLKNAQAVYISQSYIEENGERKRIRKRGVDGEFSYYLTMKKTLDGFKKLEIEEKITEDEYNRLYSISKNNLTIEKTRYCLSENNTYYEIDVYPFWDDKAVMEIELKSENEKYVFPKNIEVVKDVSSDKSYSNYNLARILDENKKIRCAVIGRNFVVDWFIAALKQHENIILEAVYSRNENTGREYADKYNVKKVYTDIEALCNDKMIDFVYIASPNICHKEQSIKLLNAKKHVICEKPAVLSEKDFSDVLLCAEKNNCVFMEAIIPAHSPALKKIINEEFEKIGKIRHVFLNYCQYSSRYDKFKNGIIENAFIPSLGNGALMDIGVYPVSIMEYLFGLPKKLTSHSMKLEGSIDSNGAILADYDGMICEIIYSKVSDSFLKSEIQGEKGSIIIDRMSRPFKYTVILRNGEKYEVDIKNEKEDMYFEISDFLKLISEKNDEYNTHTKNVLKILDEVRKQNKIEF